MSNYILDFEKPLKELEQKIQELELVSIKTGTDVSATINDIKEELERKKNEIYSSLSRWEIVQLARHPNRPISSDVIKYICTYWLEIHGDRKYADDESVICGLAKINDISFFIVAQEKGRGTKNKVRRNFGMMKPEGYRKAERIMYLAEKYSIPILTLIDTPGAYPGIGAEERGQAEAIAKNLFVMAGLKTIIISIVIGEGASGGALGIGVCDKLMCLENTWYSVISPEGCASILYRDASRANNAADEMKVTAKDLYEMKIADSIIKEPDGGAHLNHQKASMLIKDAVLSEYHQLKKHTIEELLNNRRNKYSNIGIWDEDEG